MGIIKVNQDELFDVLQHINLVKLRFGQDDVWSVAPVLYSTESTLDVLIDYDRLGKEIVFNEKVAFIFNRYGYEYIVNGEITNLNSTSTASLTIAFSQAHKYNNQRRYIRFDTNLTGYLRKPGSEFIYGQVRNISKGGALLVVEEDLGPDSLVVTKIDFSPGRSFIALGKIMRKSRFKEGSFSYGIQFIEISREDSDILESEIKLLEKNYLKSLNNLRKITSSSDQHFDTKIAILSFNIDESYEIRERLTKLGANNFDAFNNFRFYMEFFAEEKPKIVIIDADRVDDEVITVAHNTRRNFQGMDIIVMLPIEYSQENQKTEAIFEGTNILYKPLIYNEFEQEIMKYL